MNVSEREVIFNFRFLPLLPLHGFQTGLVQTGVGPPFHWSETRWALEVWLIDFLYLPKALQLDRLVDSRLIQVVDFAITQSSLSRHRKPPCGQAPELLSPSSQILLFPCVPHL